MVLIHSQSGQVITFSSRLFFRRDRPNTVPKPVSQPFIDGLQLGMDTRKAVIVYPPPLYFCKLFKSLIEAVRFGFLSNLLKLAFERFPTVLFHQQLVFSFNPLLVCRNKRMSQQFKIGWSSDTAALRASPSHSVLGHPYLWEV